MAAGADYITLREPGVAADLLSPKTFKEMIKPRLTRILNGLERSPKVLHICGSTDPLIEMMWKIVTDSGGQAVSVDIKNNLLESRKKLGNDALIVGNFDVFKLPCAEETTVETGHRRDQDQYRRSGGCRLAGLRSLAGHQGREYAGH